MLRIGLVAALAALGVAVAGPPALAHFDATDRYTHRTCPATTGTRSDPVNLVFTSWGTWGRAAAQVESHLGWTVGSGSTQYLADHGGCSRPHAQRASGHGSRFHIRIRGQHWDPVVGWASVGAAHHEDLVLFPVPCGHAVDASGPGGSGFDQGRDELVRRFTEAGHASSRIWWGNTQSFKQCDGDYAASDGWAAFIQLHQLNH